MNPVIDNILTRRSCRSFSDKPIAKKDIETLLNCARYAPNAKNRRSWKFTAVLNQELIKKLAAAIGKAIGNDAYNFYRPTAIIIPSHEADAPYTRDNSACALQTIFLAAHSLGINSVWVNQADGQCDNQGVRAVLTELGIPANHVVYGIASLGYAASALQEPEKTCETAILE